jgi:hypothetical protein
MSLATDTAQGLTTLTQRLTERLAIELAAFEARRPQDVANGMAETQDMANRYRREAARVKADPQVLSGADLTARRALIAATEAFEAILARHARAVEAARIVSEGLVQTIAGEVAAARAMGTGYGASGRAPTLDGRAITMNRTA